jgi:F-type H+-transporting ATPase subunit gamma
MKLQEILKSSKEIKNVVNSMKSIAEMNVKVYERISKNLDIYKNNIEISLQGIISSGKIELNSIEYFKRVEEKKTLNIVFGSNQGLCGRFNDKILDFTLENINNNLENIFLIMGDRLSLFAENKKLNFESLSMPNYDGVIIYTIHKIIKIIEKHKTDSVYLYYIRNDNTISGVLQKTRLIPIDNILLTRLKDKKWITNKIPQWRVDTKTLILNLLRQYIFVLINDVLINSMTTEYKNRLFTLQNADDNIGDIIKTKTAQYNQKRQSKITQELLDVIRFV